MQRPRHPLRGFRTGQSTIGLNHLQRHSNVLEKLTKQIKDVLPSQCDWQVASYREGTLTVATDNTTVANQLRYLQLQFITQLQQYPEFADLKRIKVILSASPTYKRVHHEPLPALSEDTKQLLREAANMFDDPEISEALARIASKS